jgi:hypothetical protein
MLNNCCTQVDLFPWSTYLDPNFGGWLFCVVFVDVMSTEPTHIGMGQQVWHTYQLLITDHSVAPWMCYHAQM